MEVTFHSTMLKNANFLWHDSKKTLQKPETIQHTIVMPVPHQKMREDYMQPTWPPLENNCQIAGAGSRYMCQIPFSERSARQCRLPNIYIECLQRVLMFSPNASQLRQYIQSERSCTTPRHTSFPNRLAMLGSSGAGLLLLCRIAHCSGLSIQSVFDLVMFSAARRVLQPSHPSLS